MILLIQTKILLTQIQLIQIQLLQIQDQGIRREIQYLNNLKAALDSRILNLSITLRDIAKEIKRLKTFEVDVSKPVK